MGIDLTQLIVLWPINYCQDPRTLNAIQTTITVLSEISVGPKFTLGACTPWTHLAETFLYPKRVLYHMKAYTVRLFGPKDQSFRNKSGKAQSIRTEFGVRGHVKG